MERLTRWNGEKYILPQGRTSDGQSNWRLIAERLGAYEDTGYTSEELTEPMYEIAHVEDGEIVRGGIKAPLLTVGKWIQSHLELSPDVVEFAIPADGNAVTETELIAELSAYFEERGLK